jgi:hypothetical protein
VPGRLYSSPLHDQKVLRLQEATHHPPSVAPKQDEHLTFTFVTDGAESVVVDELHVDIMPVPLGSGLRSFESASLERVRLEKISVQEVGARTSLRFGVKQ